MNKLTESQKLQLIKELEKRELPEDTLKARWKRLNEIWQLANELDLRQIKEGKTIIYERWAKLKEKYESGEWDGR